MVLEVSTLALDLPVVPVVLTPDLDQLAVPAVPVVPTLALAALAVPVASTVETTMLDVTGLMAAVLTSEYKPLYNLNHF